MRSIAQLCLFTGYRVCLPLAFAYRVHLLGMESGEFVSLAKLLCIQLCLFTDYFFLFLITRRENNVNGLRILL